MRESGLSPSTDGESTVCMRHAASGFTPAREECRITAFGVLEATSRRKGHSAMRLSQKWPYGAAARWIFSLTPVRAQGRPAGRGRIWKTLLCSGSQRTDRGRCPLTLTLSPLNPAASAVLRLPAWRPPPFSDVLGGSGERDLNLAKRLRLRNHFIWFLSKTVRSFCFHNSRSRWRYRRGGQARCPPHKRPGL